MANDAMEQVTIDAFMLYKTTAGEQVWVLAAIDTFTRYAWAIELKLQKAQDQAEALAKTVLQLGVPKVIVADHHPAYDSYEFANWAANQGIRIDLSPGYSTKHVALVNRLYRTLREMILKSSEDNVAPLID